MTFHRLLRMGLVIAVAILCMACVVFCCLPQGSAEQVVSVLTVITSVLCIIMARWAIAIYDKRARR